MIAFGFDAATGEAFEVLGTLSGLEPSRTPISTASMALHSTTNDMVAGQCLNLEAITRFVDGLF